MDVSVDIGVSVHIDFLKRGKDMRPTKKQFKAMPAAHRLALLTPTMPNPVEGEPPIPVSEDVLEGFRQRKLARRRPFFKKKAQNGQGNAVKSRLSPRPSGKA